MKIIDLTRESKIDQKTLDGQSLYSKNLLKFYDIGVNLISNNLIWKCPRSKILQVYNENISSNHLEIGPGTGYFLDKCNFPTNSPSISLLDLNENPLLVTKERLKRFSDIKTYKANVLSPIHLNKKFSSIGINYVLHCLLGGISGKSVVFKNFKCLLEDNGVIFGSTILYDLTEKCFIARKLAEFYNKKKVFSNQQDTFEGLEKVLKENFENFKLETIGSVGIFSCRNVKNER